MSASSSLGANSSSSSGMVDDEKKMMSDSSASSSNASESTVSLYSALSGAPTIQEQPLTGSYSNAPIWLQEAPPHTQLYPPLTKDGERYEVAVIGAGIVGVSTAYLLKKAGKKVVLIEGRRIGCGTTGSSTCKLTSNHQLLYTELISKFGEANARLFGEMQETALTQVDELCRQLKLECDFRRTTHTTYTSDEAKVKEVQQEAVDAARIGLPSEFVVAADLELPPSIDVKAGVRFRNQAEINAYKFCVQLAKYIDGDGCRVYEGTTLTSTSGFSSPHELKFDGTDIKLIADHVVLATHVPLMDRSAHVVFLPPSKSHVIALKLNKGDASRGLIGAGDVRSMYINCDPEKRSIRTTQDGAVLIVSGESFETGDETDVSERYDKLEKWARQHFVVDHLITKWSAMDYYSSSRLPYIGYLYRSSDSIYTATGMSKWGLLNGVASGMIIRDLIMGVKNRWAKLVDARRWDLPHSGSGLAMEVWHMTKHLISDKIKARAAPDIGSLRPGEGNIVKAGGEIVGAYRDMNGNYHLVKPICTHLGCNIVFNKTDKVYDCPCHGTQYDIDGKVIHGPAATSLCKRNDLQW